MVRKTGREKLDAELDSRSCAFQPSPLIPFTSPGFSGLIPVAEDDSWGKDAPERRPSADPANHPPLAPLLRELAAGEAAAMGAAYGPASVLLGGGLAPAAAMPAPGVALPTARPPRLGPAALEAAALAALDAGDVPSGVAHLRAAGAACPAGVGGGRAAARIARYLAAAEACLSAAP